MWGPAQEILDTITIESILNALPDLSKLTHPEKDALILALAAELAAAQERIATQDARIAALEARLDALSRPAKTPDNSSKPPSQGQKQDRPPTERPPRKSRPGVGRTLHPNPDRVVDAANGIPGSRADPAAGLRAHRVAPDQAGRDAGASVRRPLRLLRRAGECSPFGQSIAAFVVYLHYAHAIGMERLSTLMDEIFSLSISEGAISNILARAREPLLAAAATIRATVLASPVVCSDETSARVSGKNWWEWVFIGTRAALHVIRPSRAKAVVQALFGEIRPMVWVSDMLGSQRGHAAEWQVCLAHLLRDATYAIECGDTAFSAAFKRLLLRAIAIGRRRDELKDITLTQYLADLDRRLSRIMAAVPIGEPGRKLRKRIAANRPHLFVFVTNRSVPYTNNVSERHLRPSVIFRRIEQTIGKLKRFKRVAMRCEKTDISYSAIISFAFVLMLVKSVHTG